MVYLDYIITYFRYTIPVRNRPFFSLTFYQLPSANNTKTPGLMIKPHHHRHNSLKLSWFHPQLLFLCLSCRGVELVSVHLTKTATAAVTNSWLWRTAGVRTVSLLSADEKGSVLVSTLFHYCTQLRDTSAPDVINCFLTRHYTVHAMVWPTLVGAMTVDACKGCKDTTEHRLQAPMTTLLLKAGTQG